MKKSYFLLLAMALVLSACKPDVEACFTTSASGLTVTFSPSCSIEAEAWYWEFGDGETSIAENPTHTYAGHGNYSATLKVEDKRGKSNTVTNFVSACPPCANGQCVDGSCQCAPGYEGVDCSTPVNAKFSGNYAATDNVVSFGQYTYGMNVYPVSGTLNQARFYGIWWINGSAVANIGNDGLSFTMPRQPLTVDYDIELTSGTSNATGTYMIYSYKIYQTGSSVVFEDCTGSITR